MVTDSGGIANEGRQVSAGCRDSRKRIFFRTFCMRNFSRRKVLAIFANFHVRSPFYFGPGIFRGVVYIGISHATPSLTHARIALNLVNIPRKIVGGEFILRGRFDLFPCYALGGKKKIILRIGASRESRMGIFIGWLTFWLRFCRILVLLQYSTILMIFND